MAKSEPRSTSGQPAKTTAAGQTDDVGNMAPGSSNARAVRNTESPVRRRAEESTPAARSEAPAGTDANDEAAEAPPRARARRTPAKAGTAKKSARPARK